MKETKIRITGPYNKVVNAIKLVGKIGIKYTNTKILAERPFTVDVSFRSKAVAIKALNGLHLECDTLGVSVLLQLNPTA